MTLGPLLKSEERKSFRDVVISKNSKNFITDETENGETDGAFEYNKQTKAGVSVAYNEGRTAIWYPAM